MPARTLVAYAHDDGFTLHRAHGEPQLSPAHPFGREDTFPARVRARLRALGIRAFDPDGDHPEVHADPVATSLDWQGVLAAVDAREDDWLFRVHDDWTVTRYRVVSLDLSVRVDCPIDDSGVLLPVEAHETDYAVGWVEGVKSTVADGLRCGLADPETASDYLQSRIERFAGDRETYRV
ncbi:DUF6735 family protein [Natronomonas sp. EA1]|uniref:DUF6735 family protein n=1 Tax=Natronomonas sp. EA1 TaxID=3421655 RepID=UPI003EB79F50